MLKSSQKQSRTRPELRTMETKDSTSVNARDVCRKMQRLAELIEKGTDIGEVTQSGTTFRYESDGGQVRMRIVRDKLRVVHYGGGMKTHQSFELDNIESIDVTHESYSPRYQTPLLTIRLFEQFGDTVEVAFSDANRDRRA